jgi:carbon storage regulator
MLTLTRRVGDKIFIGEDITIIVTGIRNSQVRISIEAPHDIEIGRCNMINKSKIKKAQMQEAIEVVDEMMGGNR